ncbi:hypothetical protein Rhal01_01269 [Rubritalea halochordaticola]|uniref:Ice-binding protein C-terminal domain-containing protein n=2 Tax=Rubritalea halochordaticola TaxID=714537 RepID=A0ABP9V384_9BACT
MKNTKNAYTMKLTQTLLALTATLSAANAAIVFTDSFDYTVDNAFLAEGGWTTVIDTGSGLGANSATGVMWGNPGASGEAALEYNYTTTLVAGDVISMDATIVRNTSGYIYGKEIILWDGADSGTRVSKVDDSQAGNIVTTTSYTVTQDDINAGLTQVIFKYSHDGNWGETADVTFDIVSVPEPTSTALLGLGGLALILRRRR